jgi:uncharacterized membrane protein YcgQ (UPF0703/DUF1980 family)
VKKVKKAKEVKKVKRWLAAFLGFSLAALAALGRQSASLAAQGDDSNIFEIREKMFIEQCNDIYLNPDDYQGRTIKLEGIYEEENEEGSVTARYVIRYGPGCCGNDGMAGFEVVFDDAPAPAPQRGDWVEAIGAIQRLKDTDELEYVVLKLSQLKVMDVRGAEFVSN